MHYAFAENTDRKKLDWTILDEEEPDVLNYDMTRWLFHFMRNTNHVFDGNDSLFHTQTIARALITLSEDCILEDINACFSCGYDEITEEPFELDYRYLSETPVDVKRILVAYREFRTSENHFAKDEFMRTATRGYKTNQTYMTCFGNFGAGSSSEAVRYIDGKYPGNNIWHDMLHFDIAWKDQRHCLGRII